MIHYSKTLVFVLTFLLVAMVSKAQNYIYHSVFVYNFTKFIEWPKQNSELKIGIVGGDKDALDAFKKMASTKSTADRKYVVTACNTESSGWEYQVLFFPKSQSDKIKTYAELLKNKPVLILSEKEGMIKQGSLINFVTIDQKLRFEVNKAQLEASTLKISSQLYNFGIVN